MPEAGHPGAARSLRPAAFLDRDGVINIDDGYTVLREDFHFVPGALQAAARLHALGFALVIVTNQSGIARGMYGEADFHALMQWVRGQFERAGAPLAGVYFCPHHPEHGVGQLRVDCDCRKPAPGMLLQASAELGLDPARSVMFGDKVDDLRAALAAGVDLRVWLGKDGKALPAGEAPDGLASARYRSLLDAVEDPVFSARLAQLGSQEISP